ncbi:hypothetical protein NP233_g11735 [Leucocoprinus birnbaumii]|uniref:F-box domain-containing protein n=1 Tax=Leucocoprinus birnbaumii TaxID=56174 RepID=A0AAD5VJJ0_9AGAR|nr:hypothetical protein NP233_g11735 [Leucocoprinus birnbaumii]
MSVQLQQVSTPHHHTRVCRRRISSSACHEATTNKPPPPPPGIHCTHSSSSTTPSSFSLIVPGSSRLYPSKALAFPTELLLIIFNFVFDDLASYCADSPEAHKECDVCNGVYQNAIPAGAGGSAGQNLHVVWEWQDDVLSDALFPYSIAGVCRRWRDIMATVPQFWTRLIVFVDDPTVSAYRPSTPPLTPPWSSSSSLPSTSSEPPASYAPTIDAARNIHSHLSWSAQLPIEVYVLRRRHSTSLGIDKTERSRTRLVFEAIKPHLHRCHVLRFSVLQSSSLPSLVHDFAGVKAPVLTDLRLECEVDDGVCALAPVPLLQPSTTSVSTVPVFSTQGILRNRILHSGKFSPSSAATSSSPLSTAGFWCPVLNALSLNGRNFRDLALMLKRHRHSQSHLQRDQDRTLNGSATFYMTLEHVEKVTIAYYTEDSPSFESGVASGTEASATQQPHGAVPKQFFSDSEPSSLPVHLRREAQGGDEKFRMEDLLEVVERDRMPNLEFLKLVDLDLSVGDGEGERVGDLRLIRLMATHIHLEEVAPSVVRCFQHIASPFHARSPAFRVFLLNELEALHVIRCSLPSPRDWASENLRSPSLLRLGILSSSWFPKGTDWVVPDTCDLVLEEVSDFGGRMSPLRYWQGCRLFCTGCTGVDDEFLKMLRTSFLSQEPRSQPPGQFDVGLNARNLQSIHLNDCDNFSVAELKKVVEVRNGGRLVGSMGPSCEILELSVKGIRPELGEEDRVWFEERIMKFEWGSRRQKGKRRRRS